MKLTNSYAKTRDFDNKCIRIFFTRPSFADIIRVRGYIEGGYYFFTRPSTAGIIRMRVLFEGGSYLRKYGMYFDTVVVEVETFLLLFRLALAILW